jgi:hypothetical protein
MCKNIVLASASYEHDGVDAAGLEPPYLQTQRLRRGRQDEVPERSGGSQAVQTRCKEQRNSQGCSSRLAGSFAPFALQLHFC